jgi:hypothetical protein
VGVDEIERVSELVGGLLGSPLPESDEGLCDLLVGVHRLQARLGALKAKVMAAADARRAYAADGSKTVSAWLARACHASPAVVRAEARLGRRLRTMPVSMGALSGGEIGREHVEVLARVAHSPRVVLVAAFAGAEEMLVGFARDLSFEDFVRAVNHWINVVDPDGSEGDAGRSFEQRRLHLSQTLDGAWVLDGRFDAISGTIVDTALRRIEQDLFQDEWTAARAANGGQDPTNDQLSRSPAQRRADALVEMAKRAMAMPKGARKPRPLVTVVVGLDTLGGRICELFNKMPVAPGQVARLLDGALVERVVFDSPSRVIDLGTQERFFRGGLRRAIEIRDRHCQWPGCTQPADDCQVDHIQPHSWGGQTDQTNGRLLCAHHNRWRANSGKPQPQPQPPDEAAA